MKKKPYTFELHDKEPVVFTAAQQTLSAREFMLGNWGWKAKEEFSQFCQSLGLDDPMELIPLEHDAL